MFNEYDASLKRSIITIKGGFHTFYENRIDNRDLDVISAVANVLDRYCVVYKLMNTRPNDSNDYKFTAIGKILEYKFTSAAGGILAFSTKDTECTVWFIYQ